MYLIISIILLIFLATFIYAGLSGATWVPTKKNDVARFLKLADLKTGEKFYDLGCGNARMTIVASKQGANAVGLEVSLFPYLLGKLNVWFNYYLSLRAKCNEAKQSRSQRDCHVASLLAMTPKILYRDLWKYDLSDADVIYFFLMPSKMNRLRKKFEKELKPGARVISYVWPIEGWTPIKVDECEGWPKIFLYEI